MGDSYSWIRTVLMSDLKWRGGIDFDRDGVIRPNEQIQNYNQDGLVGDPGDWKHFFASNADALRRRVAFFGWGSPFKADNPIHELLAIESELASPEEIRETYMFTAEVLRIVRERLADGQARSNLEKVQLIYSVIKETGIDFANQYPLVSQWDPLLTKSLTYHKVIDCDASSFIAKVVAHELGWPVFLVLVPRHAFVRWEGEGERFNVDYGESFDDSCYASGSCGERREISPQAISAGVYLASLTPLQLRALFFFNRGLAKFNSHRYEEATADLGQAIHFNPNFAAAYFMRGIVAKELGYEYMRGSDYYMGRRLDPLPKR